MIDKKSERETDYTKNKPTFAAEIKITNFQKPETLVGQLLDGRFLIEQNLTDDGADKGGFGLVYLAKDLRLNEKKTVVKILKKESLNDDSLRKFNHEKEALIRLDHPNTVRILDSGTLPDSNPFLVMEYISGYSLRRVLKEKGKLSLEFVAHIILSISEALSAAHAQKILHRDIKPENIMLTPQETNFEWVRLIDFGIARVENSLLADATQEIRGIGSPRYVAPEQIAGDLTQTPAVDIFSFAIVIYEMLTGETPFKPEAIEDILSLQLKGVEVSPRRLRVDLPEKAEQILLSGLEFDAKKRPQNVREFGHNLANALCGEQTSDLFITDQLNNKDRNFIAAPTVASSPEQYDYFSNPSLKTQPRKISKNAFWKLMLGGLLSAMILGFVGLIYWKSSEPKIAVTTPDKTTADVPNPATAETNGAARELTYYLNVQKMRGGKPFEAPFKSSGREIFENGYKFKLIFQSDAAGFVYLFSEDKNARGETVYHILYPTPKTNNGSAEIAANEQMETSNNTFSGNRGTEIVRLVWTLEKQEVLEAARQSAFDSNGTIKDEKIVRRLTDFLQKYAEQQNEVSKDTENQQTVIKGKGDIVVEQIELEHR